MKSMKKNYSVTGRPLKTALKWSKIFNVIVWIGLFIFIASVFFQIGLAVGFRLSVHTVDLKECLNLCSLVTNSTLTHLG